jgi:phosphoglycolate phosphatase-like HAD superfamily hydrolase
MKNGYAMSEAHESVNEAIERLRDVLREHDRRGEPDTPFYLGIREALADRDAYSVDADSAA